LEVGILAWLLLSALVCPMSLGNNAINYVTILGVGPEMEPSVCVTTKMVRPASCLSVLRETGWMRHDPGRGGHCTFIMNCPSNDTHVRERDRVRSLWPTSLSIHASVPSLVSSKVLIFK
jgi:hypothetical protein